MTQPDRPGSADRSAIERRSAASVVPTASATRRSDRSAVRTSTVDGGFWAERPADQPGAHDPARLRPAATAPAPWTTCGWRPARTGSTGRSATPVGVTFPFLDTDVYKWLEAVGWELGRGADAACAAAADEAIAAGGRPPSGRTATSTASSRWSAAARRTRISPGATSSTASATSSRPRSPGTARSATTGCSTSRSAPPTASTASSARTAATGIDGHPEIEMALVELFRITGEPRYLDARRPDDRPARPRPPRRPGRFGPAYWQDHAPVREAPTVAGPRGPPALPRLRRGRRRGRDRRPGAARRGPSRRWRDMVAHPDAT